MIGDDNMIKIIDFGESRISDNDNYFPTLKNQVCGSKGYMDPVMEFGGEGFQEKSDLWSLGATLYYILTNQILPINGNYIYTNIKKFPGDQRKEIKLTMIQEMIDQAIVQLQFSDECKELLDKLLKVDLKQRYGWNELFNNSLIKQLLESLQLNQKY